MTNQVLAGVISALCLCKALLEMTSIVKTEFFVKLFYFDFKKDISSVNLRRFRFLDIANCLVSAVALGLFAITAQAFWIILAVLFMVLSFVLMYNH